MYSDRGGSIVRSLPHITIACAAVWAGSRLIGSTPERNTPPVMNPDDFSQSSGVDDGLFAGSIDYRLVAFGSLLPDMVDRAIRAASGRTWSRDQHLLGHTLLLNAPVVVAGISLARRRQDARLLAVGAAAMTHLMVDPVIRSPRTLLWPLLGRDFPESRGLSRPLTMLTQIGAAAAVLATLFTLQRRGRLSDFIARGSL
jgi:LexA-binding, inner membrane-associated putative hydrolase